MFQVIFFVMWIIKYYQHYKAADYKLILLDSNRLQAWLHFKSQIGIILMTINVVKAVLLATP